MHPADWNRPSGDAGRRAAHYRQATVAQRKHLEQILKRNKDRLGRLHYIDASYSTLPDLGGTLWRSH